jgi:hypothetical protein
VIDNFMTARLRAPRNTAMMSQMTNHGFQIKSSDNGVLKNLIDIIGQSSFPYVNIGHGIIGIWK